MQDPTPEVSKTFLVVTFVASAAIGILIIYLGIGGKISGPIP
jgi:hypothetical protein